MLGHNFAVVENLFLGYSPTTVRLIVKPLCVCAWCVCVCVCVGVCVCVWWWWCAWCVCVCVWWWCAWCVCMCLLVCTSMGGQIQLSKIEHASMNWLEVYCSLPSRKWNTMRACMPACLSVGSVSECMHIHVSMRVCVVTVIIHCTITLQVPAHACTYGGLSSGSNYNILKSPCGPCG